MLSYLNPGARLEDGYVKALTETAAPVSTPRASVPWTVGVVAEVKRSFVRSKQLWLSGTYALLVRSSCNQMELGLSYMCVYAKSVGTKEFRQCANNLRTLNVQPERSAPIVLLPVSSSNSVIPRRKHTILAAMMNRRHWEWSARCIAIYSTVGCTVVRQMYVYGDLLKIGSLLREYIPFSN